jgi:hypothetical protein
MAADALDRLAEMSDVGEHDMRVADLEELYPNPRAMSMPPPTAVPARGGSKASKPCPIECGEHLKKGQIVCTRCFNLCCIRWPWRNVNHFFVWVEEEPDNKAKVHALLDKTSELDLTPSQSVTTVKQLTTSRLRITGPSEEFIMQKHMTTRPPAEELDTLTFMGEKYYGISGMNQAPVSIKVTPEYLVSPCMFRSCSIECSLDALVL